MARISSNINKEFNAWNTMTKYKVIGQSMDIDGVILYSVSVSDEVLRWLFDTFKKDVDFIYVRQLKGIWFDMPEKTFALLKLKWS